MRTDPMMIERTWRRRLILSFIIFNVWGSSIGAILSFGSANPDQLKGIRLVGESILLILLYYFLINRIMRFDWITVKKRRISTLRLLLWLFYPLLAIGIYGLSLPLQLNSFLFSSNVMAIVSRIGSFGIMFLVIAMLFIFHRWHMAFRTTEHEQSTSTKPENS